MSTIKKFRVSNNKFIFVFFCIIIFFASLIYQLPSWTVGSMVNKYSEGKLKLFNANGSFWSGDALLVADNEKKNNSSAIALIHWHSKLGLDKYLDVDFFIGDNKIADLYINKKGIFISNLLLVLPLKEVTLFFEAIQDLKVSGIVTISADKINYNNTFKGNLKITINNLSSAISKVNPLGNYQIYYDLSSLAIKVTTLPDSVLQLNGDGYTNNLSLEGSIVPEKRDDMRQFISIFGEPLPNGNYKLKVF